MTLEVTIPRIVRSHFVDPTAPEPEPRPLFKTLPWNFGHAELARPLGSCKVRVALLVEAFGQVAEIVAVVTAVTFSVEMEKLAELDPARIVTLAGTVTDLRLLVSVIFIPPFGAASFSATVPVVVVPPGRLAGLRVRL